MKALQKNWLSPIRSKCVICINKMSTMLILFFIFSTPATSQISNYVSNGSFEQLNPGVGPYDWNACKYWQPMDSINKVAYYLCTTTPSIQNAPYVTTGFQYPRRGNSFVGLQVYCGSNACNASNSRGYPRNRLKQPLQSGKTYCTKYHVVNTNNNVVAIDSYGIYFADNIIDTIIYCMNAISYLNPQVQHTGGIITDTLNWTLITGTFVANGGEKYMVLGNFKSNAATNTLQTNPPSFAMTADIYIDDASVIDIDLPAYAGPDVWGIPTNTVYLGRQNDVGIDEACTWFKLPNTTMAIDTAAGITVTVASVTNTYMVKQDICGNVKWDTAVVYASGVGLNEAEQIKNSISVYPNPASDLLKISFKLQSEELFLKIRIFNNLGQQIRDEDLKNNSINIRDLPNGVYLLNLTGAKHGNVSKKFVVSR